MFENALSSALKKIFDLKKATYDLPGEVQEQECIFIEVDQARTTIKDNRQIARVTGRIRVFANLDKLPYGFFSKRIHEADPDDTKPFYFYEIEQNGQVFKNICERTLSFVYFFDSQYDPALGIINEVTIQVSE